MPLFDVTVSGKYKCHGAKGYFEYRDFNTTYTFEMANENEDIRDEIHALLQLDAPADCVENSYHVDGIFEHFGDDLIGGGGPIEPGPAQTITVYATVACDNCRGGVAYHTIRTDVLSTDTRDNVLKQVWEVAVLKLVTGCPESYCEEVLSIEITAPFYYAYA